MGISLRGRPSSFRFPGILQNSSDSPLPFCLSPSGKDEAKTASLLRSFWRTTTRRSRTPSMRAGSWLSPVRAGRGRPPRPSSTRGRPTSWSDSPGGTCWARGGRLKCSLSPCPCSLWASGLDFPINSAQGAAEEWNHWGRTAQENHYRREKKCSQRIVLLQSSAHTCFCLILLDFVYFFVLDRV